MTSQSSESLLSHFDAAPLNRRYWVSFALLSAITVLDFFDFFLIAFILAVIGPQWHLTYGESAVILYGGGIGAIIGALLWGSLADIWGRKLQIVTGTLICAISAGLIGLLPTGMWVLLAVLRILVGFGLAAAVTPALTIVVELTPTRFRTGVTSFYVVFASVGTLLASYTSAMLLSHLGWRGVAMLGIVPAFFGLLIWAFVPESARWLTAKGRFAAAREVVAKHLGLPPGSLPLPNVPPLAPPRGRLSELYADPRLFWQTVIIWGASSTAVYGYYLWGPTIVALVLKVPVAPAAGSSASFSYRRSRRCSAAAASAPCSPLSRCCALPRRAISMRRCSAASRSSSCSPPPRPSSARAASRISPLIRSSSTGCGSAPAPPVSARPPTASARSWGRSPSP